MFFAFLTVWWDDPRVRIGARCPKSPPSTTQCDRFLRVDGDDLARAPRDRSYRVSHPTTGMVRKSLVLAGATAGIAAAAGVWSLYQRQTTETVPYTAVASVGDVELRRYPDLVLVETVAPSTREAFRRLFRYISGDNDGGDHLEMTAPVELTTPGPSIPMTAPVELARPTRTLPMTTPVETTTNSDEEGVRMAFYLPPEYDVDSAPRPTAGGVDLVSVPARTLAVRQFSWRATDRRVARETERLLADLEAAGVPLDGDPFFMGYDAPWTLPFLRRNEVAVAVEANGH